jgi:hypothetical protein
VIDIKMVEVAYKPHSKYNKKHFPVDKEIIPYESTKVYEKFIFYGYAQNNAQSGTFITVPDNQEYYITDITAAEARFGGWSSTEWLFRIESSETNNYSANSPLCYMSYLLPVINISFVTPIRIPRGTVISGIYVVSGGGLGTFLTEIRYIIRGYIKYL